MPSYTCILKDVLSLIKLDSMPLEKFEACLECAKSELKGYDMASGEVKLENNDTNRPDLWSAEGTARQIRNCHFGGRDSYGFFEEAPQEDHRIIVSGDLKDVRPYIGGFTVTGISVTDDFLRELIQTQEKLCENYGRSRDLISIGVYNAREIRFPLYFNGYRPGSRRFAPLGFTEELDLAEILEKHPKGREYGHLVKSSPFYPLIVDSREKVLSFAPIINSNDLGCVAVGDDFLFVDVTGKEREPMTLALNIMACNMADRGGTIHPFTIVYPDGGLHRTPFRFEKPVTLDLSFAETYVGESLTDGEAREHLEKMGHAVTEAGQALKCVPPPYRLDCLHQVDLIEDICIGRGYGTFVPQMPEKFTIGASRPVMRLTEVVGELMLGMGFQEVMTYILTSQETLSAKMQHDEKPVAIDNVMSETYGVIRSSLVPILLEIESKNPRVEYPHRIFETGEVVLRDSSRDEGVATVHHLGALVAHSSSNFSEAHSTLQSLLWYLQIPYRLEKKDHPSFIEGRAGAVYAGEKEVGIIGEVHPQVLENWGITCPCAAFELSLDDLLPTLQGI
ncbi:MAG: phenylalanine--tRNA ligase subunit beta [Candidatus Eremiobacteraeota bacterium]|nr:phenylalanine--tRNA ligase subunit beta [Candidatus Eremiobacteraeota bacterium]